jgi:CPA2 family monovalent cation:H+ antiporter-2
MAAVVVVLGAAFWRTAAQLHGHVRAGAQVIVEVLAKQSASGDHVHPQGGADALAGVRAMFPGIGEPTGMRLREDSPAAGRSLSELGVRGRTGATVLAISRAGGSVMVPAAGEVLRPGDLVVLAGTHEALEAARELLGADPIDGRAGVTEPATGRVG